MNVSEAAPQDQHQSRLSRRFTVARKADQVIHLRRAEFNLRFILPWIEAGSTVADIGAGDGLLASSIQQQADARVRGFDIEARELSNFQVEVYDGNHIPAEEGAFDTSICVAVLHHCDDAERVVSEIARVTRKRFLLVEDRFDSALDRWGVIGFHHYLKWVERMPFNPAGFRTTQAWCSLLEKHGFEIRKIVPMGRSMKLIPIHNTLLVAEKKAA